MSAFVLCLGAASVVNAEETDGQAASNAAAANAAVAPNPRLSVANSTDGVLAIVNDNIILKSDLINAIAQTQQRYQAAGEQAPSAQQLQSEVLDALIMRELQLSMINRAGLQPNQNTVNQRMLQLAQSQGLSSLEQLQQQMDAARPGAYAELRQQVIEEASIQSLQQRQVASRVRITEQDIDAFLASPEAQRLNQTEYQTVHVRVPYLDDYSRLTEEQRAQALAVAEQIRSSLVEASTDEEILSAMNAVQSNYPVQLQGGNMGFHKASGLPTTLASQITQLDVGQVSEPMVTPEGIDIIKLADTRSSDAIIVPQWHTRHILLKVDDMQTTEIAEQRINDLYEQLRRGADFADLASTYSDDPGSAGKGGDLDWVSEEQMVPAFEQAMKNTPVGDFSAPFQSQYGWHILQVLDTRDQNVTDQYRRNMARDALYQRMAPQAQEDWLQELRSTAYIQVFN